MEHSPDDPFDLPAIRLGAAPRLLAAVAISGFFSPMEAETSETSSARGLLAGGPRRRRILIRS
jgi:hypothetical protein